MTRARKVRKARNLCTATRRDGTPCERMAVLGATVCPNHGGALRLTQEAARERIDRLVAPALAALADLVVSADMDAVRLAAARDLLDRAGYKPVERIAAQVSTTIEVVYTEAAQLVSDLPALPPPAIQD